MAELLDRSAQEQAAAIASGDISSVELTQQTLGRIADTGDWHAFTEVTTSRALAEAALVDAQRARGQALPPLAGVPYAVKNLFDIAGLPTLAGSNRALPQAAATADAVLIQRLRAQGAVLVGALNMDEFAYGFTTENSHHGVAHNPVAPGHLAGGSSGGCGTAVAGRLVAYSLGSDTNGSIRVPSSFCGIWGLKPSYGALTRSGSRPFVTSLDHLGPLARSVTDLALVFDACLGSDSGDPACRGERAQATLPQLDRGLEGLRIARLSGYFDAWALPEAQQAVHHVAQALGVSDEVEWPSVELARAAAYVITASEGGQLHLPHLREHYALLEPLSRDRFLAGALLPAAWYLQAQRFRRWFQERVAAAFTQHQVFLAPATPCTAPAVGSEWLNLPNARLPLRPSIGLFTQPVSFLGLPVVAVPCRTASGLPIGVQVIAAPWQEGHALRVARFLETQGVCHVAGVAA